jgi:hypothetical protein
MPSNVRPIGNFWRHMTMNLFQSRRVKQQDPMIFIEGDGPVWLDCKTKWISAIDDPREDTHAYAIFFGYQRGKSKL